MDKELKKKLAKEILYWIASERENFVEADGNYNYEKYPDGRSENRYYLYTGNINYLIDFTSAYKDFIIDLMANVRYECKVENIEFVEVKKQEITLKINGIKTIIYVDDEWLKISFEEEENEQ